MAKGYVSNRQKNLKVGISSYTENQTVLQVTGKVGIGTNDASFSADVNGDLRIRSSNSLKFGGISSTTNFYIQYNSSANSLDFVAG